MTGAELGKTGFIYGFDKYYLNQRVGVIRGRSKEKELYLKILALSDEFQTLLNSKGYGSAQPNISSNDIENIIVNDITENNLKDIYEKLNSVYYKIIFNCEENLTLEQLRNTLLPKLMNGEIDLDRIEI
jgi:type I restriction enzyme S subunit